MKVFKFGGASVKDAKAVRNVSKVLDTQGFGECLLVVSAMGKTTNALEAVVNAWAAGEDFVHLLRDSESFHLDIAEELFQVNHTIFSEIKLKFSEIFKFLSENPSASYDFAYDQVVSAGEIISSKILSAYLNDAGFYNNWLDARCVIKTDSNFREANVDWDATAKKISELEMSLPAVTQGFIASDEKDATVTLGREGSDYSAAIFAYCLDAESMTIWKDVPGVMTGDPQVFENVQLLKSISYEEAIELAYYGASVIHPKTLQPLKQKNIPFFVKSFLEPSASGTKIGLSPDNQFVESYILKQNQHLLKISTKDFSFIAEEHMSHIFRLLAQNKIKISLMQNSAISLALCLEDRFRNLEELISELRKDYKVDLVKDVSLFTVRHFSPGDLEKFYEGKDVLIEQSSPSALQIVFR
ncbi:aspartate kinase [Cruoricaptor ignavus]|uniref:aspartate kinase n=1 Tax=Cruoricaptor ignavus TaxID=1118202 RepID=UPI00370D9903